MTNNRENVIDRTMNTPITAQYIRLYITKGVQSDNEPNPRARIGAFELYYTQGENLAKEAMIRTLTRYRIALSA